MDQLWTLPVALQIALGSGYLAYLVAYAGLRERHTSTDAIFRSVAFGLVATALLTWLGAGLIMVQIFAVIATVAVGAFWRFCGMDLARRILRRTDISWTDDIPTAWLSVTAAKTDHRLAGLAVDLTDGRTVVCDDTRQYREAPHGPCVLGLSGDVALYVTAERRENGEWFSHEDVLHPTEGARLTYIPASAVKRVEFRLWGEANARAEAAEMETAQDAAGAPEDAPSPGYTSGAANAL